MPPPGHLGIKAKLRLQLINLIQKILNDYQRKKLFAKAVMRYYQIDYSIFKFTNVGFF
jgi:hypothetical protein